MLHSTWSISQFMFLLSLGINLSIRFLKINTQWNILSKCEVPYFPWTLPGQLYIIYYFLDKHISMVLSMWTDSTLLSPTTGVTIPHEVSRSSSKNNYKQKVSTMHAPSTSVWGPFESPRNIWYNIQVYGHQQALTGALHIQCRLVVFLSFFFERGFMM